MKKQNWIWMPHPAHFIGAVDCQFRLATYVGKYIVSTVGEYSPHEKGKFEEIGYNRLYETMVFKAKTTKDTCCPFAIIVKKQVDQENYNTPDEATKGHMKLCEEWSKK